MKRTRHICAMLVAGALAGLAGCSEPHVQAPPSMKATTRQPLDGPALLKDIHTGAVGFPQLGWSPTMSRPLPSGGTLVTLEESFTGEELWRTDGTVAGTTLVKDIAPGLWPSSPSGFAELNGAIYFGAETDFGQSALMKTDGTAAGTVVVKYLSNLQEPDQSFESLVTAGGALYFIQAEQLWKSDGTQAGTVSIQNLLPATASAFRSVLVPMGGSVFFVAEDADHQVGALWKTDGTASGTVKLKDLSSSNSGFGTDLVVMGQTLFFIDGPFTAEELWKTDGTAAGTTLVRTHNGSLGSLTAVGSHLFFQASNALWRTDGTSAGTVQLPATNVEGLTAVGATLLFSAQDADGIELWKSDGTVAGTGRVKDLFPGPDSSHMAPLGVWNGRLIFLAALAADRVGLWSSDATEAGTVLLAERPSESNSYFYSSKPVVPVGAAVLAELPGSQEARTVFRTDGTPAGTVALGGGRAGTKDSQFTALPLAVAGSRVFFQAQDEQGTALWVSDGTSGGTVRLRGLSSPVLSAARVGSTLYFSAEDDTHGEELWKSDGTAAGTVRVKDIFPGTESAYPSNLTEFAGVLYFSARDGVNGQELWKSDGTAAGTVMVRDLFTGAEDSYPSQFAVLQGTLFFFASDMLAGALWKTDGTAAGTVKVKEADVDSTVAGGDTLFFFADDGTGLEGLWKTDGTAAGTVLVRGGLDEAVFPTWANGKLYFIARDDAHGFEPWVSDGTMEGTRVLKDIAAGSNPSFGLGFTPLGNRVLFTARDDAHGFELWSTDGTEAGTQRVTDLWPGAVSGTRLNTNDDAFNTPFEMLALADRGLAVFTGQDEAGGLELWATDGTAQGTFRHVDVAPGAASSYPTGFAALGGQLFFFAGDAASGREPRAVPLPAALDRTPPVVSCPSNVAATTADAQGTSVQYPAATASDSSGTPTLAYSQASGTRFALGDTQVTVIATDSAGNQAQCSFTVTVRLEQTPAPEPEEEGGCGCTSGLGAGAGAGWGLLLLMLASLRPGRRAPRRAGGERTRAAQQAP